MKFNDALDRLKTIADALPDDDPDKLDMLNIEGDYNKLMEWAIIKRNEHIALSDMNKDLSSNYKIRSDRFAKKADDMKDVIGMIMDSAGETKYNGIATVTVKNVPPKPVVSNELLVPKEYKKTKEYIDKVAINKAIKEGASIDGVTLDNGGKTIQIRNA